MNLTLSKLLDSEFPNRIRRWATPSKIVVVLSVVTGVAAGISSYIFEEMISFVHRISYGRFSVEGHLLSRSWILFLPALGGILTGLVIHRFSKDARGQGVAEVIFALRRNKAKIPLKTVLGKAMASAFTIGTGGSAGPEGPIIQIGGGAGSVLGQVVKLPTDLLRVIVAAGAAGGLAAVFNAPIAGVLFAMEVLLRDFVVNAFSLVVLSSVSAAVVSHLLLGDKTFLQTPPFAIHSAWELILYSFLGAIIAFVTQLFVKTLHETERVFEKWTMPDFWKPMMGGLGVGLLGWLLPPILGPGIEFMGSIVRGQVLYASGTFLIFFLLLTAKIIATSFTLGSGGSGGLLTPSFFCGGMTGALYGILMQKLFPEMGGYGPYALVGMVAFFSALSRAPLTAIILLFELTHDQHVILPTMVCCVIAAFVAQRLNPHSYELLRLGKKGLLPEDVEHRDVLSETEVDGVMVRDVVCLKEKMTFQEMRKTVEETRHTGFPVLNDEGFLVGLLADADVYTALLASKTAQLTVGAMMRKSVRTVTRNASLRSAIRIMNDSGQDRVPVVDNQNPQHVIGLVSRSQIIKAHSAGFVTP
jgi:CIC family chloride channel protein